MLLRFEASNHRSIMEAVELSMVAVDEDRPAARSFDSLSERVLTVAGIYGANASGKSNVLDSIAWLSMAVKGSLYAWDDVIPRDPFKFGAYPEKSSNFELDMMVRGVRYSYVLEVNDESVVFEGLYSYPERRRRSLFEREGMDFHLRRGLGALSGTRELLTPTTLALTAAMRFDFPEVRSFGQAIVNIGLLGGRHKEMWRRNRVVQRHASTERMLQVSSDPDQPALFTLDSDRFSGRESALALLKFADLGIDGVQIDEHDGLVRASTSLGEGRRQLRLLHSAGEQRLPFDMSEESEGTQMWFRLIGPVLYALRTGQTLLFDEIDASLHPKLSAKLLELFQDPDTNPSGAQLIFTTHDTSLLNHLNRDEVWLTDKALNGSTQLTALAEYGGDKVRRSLNLEKAYLQGRFGAVPDFDQYLLRQALGLVAEGR
jgi:hypothetical protein